MTIVGFFSFLFVLFLPTFYNLYILLSLNSYSLLNKYLLQVFHELGIVKVKKDHHT